MMQESERVAPTVSTACDNATFVANMCKEGA